MKILRNRVSKQGNLTQLFLSHFSCLPLDYFKAGVFQRKRRRQAGRKGRGVGGRKEAEICPCQIRHVLILLQFPLSPHDGGMSTAALGALKSGTLNPQF